MSVLSSSEFNMFILKGLNNPSLIDSDPVNKIINIFGPHEINEPFSFDNSTKNFPYDVVFENLKFTRFDLSQTRFKITFKNCVINELYIKKPAQRDNLSVTIIDGTYGRINISSNYQVSIINATIENLVIDDNQKFIFLNNDRPNEKMPVSNLIIRNNHSKINLTNLQIKNFELTENNFDAITCANSNIEKLEFHDFRNINMKLSKVEC
ncbi:MAG: hypothetical protein R2764_23900 [Bacteroidales bacterium]